MLALVVASRFGKAYLQIRKEERVEKKKIAVEQEKVKVERLRVEAGKEVELEKIRVKGEVAVPGAQMEAE